MNKTELFLKAMAAGEFRRTAWVVSGFALIREELEDWRKSPYAYRIVQGPTGHSFVDPENDMQLTAISDSVAGQPLYSMKDRIKLRKGDLPNLDRDVECPLGNVMVNWLCLVWPFDNKVPFQTGKITPRGLEALVRPFLEDTPAEGLPRNPKVLYIDEYLRFCDAAFFLPGFTQLCVPSATPKTMTRSPEIPAIKARLLEENKDRLHDPAVVAKMMAELVAHDRDVWMKGDPGADFYAVSGKAYNVVRAKAFLMHGAEVGLEEKVDVTLIQNSLSEGWDISKFPAMNDSLRAGSFNRGALTMLGGEAVKWLLRASVNMSVAGEDCGSTLGVPVDIEVGNHKSLIGLYLVQGKGHVEITAENSMSYVGKFAYVRSPMYCKLPKTDYCAVCVGKLLAGNPNGLSVAIADYGSKFLYMFMSAAHGKALLLAKMDYQLSIT